MPASQGPRAPRNRSNVVLPSAKVIEHDHGEYAGIREVQAVKDELLHELGKVKDEILREIAAVEKRHDEQHDILTAEGRTRHAVIDKWIADHDLARAVLTGKSTGQRTVLTNILLVFRLANEFRWLILAIVGAILLGAGHVSIEVT